MTARRMHALIVGASHYPEAARSGSAVVRRLEDIPGAEVSARSVAEWLRAEQAGDPEVPLESVELLATPGRVTLDGFLEAFQRWYDRCDDPSAVGLLYFCGHGYARSVEQQMLLLEDFGSHSPNPFVHSIDFQMARAGMLSSRASLLIYLLDTCRTVPAEADETVRLGGTVPVTIPVLRRPAVDIALYATRSGRPAYAERDRPTDFSVAVREAFNGGAAVKGPDGRWRIMADRLGPAARAAMSRLSEQEIEVDGSQGPAVLRALPGVPVVPFDIGCLPERAHRSARLSLVQSRDQSEVLSRDPGGDRWTASASAGVYDARAEFRDGDWADLCRPDEAVFPPLCRVDLWAETR